MTLAPPLDLKEGKGSWIWDEALRTFLSSADKSPDELRIFLILGTEQYISTSAHAHYQTLCDHLVTIYFVMFLRCLVGWPEY